MRTRPEPLDAQEMRDYFDKSRILGAAGKTADGTQVKRLFKEGAEFKVTRRYLVEPVRWEEVYSGDLSGAVNFYNGMG